MTTRRTILATALAAPLLAACAPGSDEKPADGGAITIWHYWDGANADAFDDAIDRYEAKHRGTTIQAVNVPSAELLTKLQTAAGTGRLPTAAIGDLVWIPRLARTGKLIDLSEPLGRAGLDADIYPAMLSFGRTGSKQVSIPVSANTIGYMYNKTLFTKAGLDPGRAPSTWEELTAAADRIKAKTGMPGYELFTQPGDGGEGVTWNFQVNLWQAGGEFLTPDSTRAAFNSDAGRRALRFWADLVGKHGTELGPWGAFEKGRAGSAQEGSWMVGIWQKEAPFDFGTSVPPIPTGARQATNMGGEQGMVFTTATQAQRDAAVDFLTWFVGPENANAWCRATGMLPVTRSVADGSAYRDWVSREAPALKPFVDLLPHAHARPNTPEYPKISFAFAKQVEQALNGRKTVDRALTDAETEVNKLLAEGR